MIPVDYSGDGNLPPRVLDMSAIPAAAPMGMMGMPPGMGATGGDQEVGDQIKAEITVGGKKNKTHYGKKFGKKHKSAMLDFTKSLWMQDAAASLRNVLKSEVSTCRCYSDMSMFCTILSRSTDHKSARPHKSRTRNLPKDCQRFSDVRRGVIRLSSDTCYHLSTD